MGGRDTDSTERSAQVAAMAQRFRDGDSTATERIRERVRRVVGFRGYGIPPEDRVDLVQAILLQVWQAVKRPDFDYTGFWGFVEIVTSRRCIDWRRTRKVGTGLERVLTTPDPGADPLGEALQREKAELAQAALARLPEDCRELIRLHAGRGKTYSEIAESLGKSEGALRVQMHRCIKRAHEILVQLTVTASAERRAEKL